MYYYLGHFSAFIPPGSVRVQTISSGPSPLEITAWETPDNDIVMVALNKDETVFGARKYQIYVPSRGYINVDMPKGSIQTIIFKAGEEDSKLNMNVATSLR